MYVINSHMKELILAGPFNELTINTALAGSAPDTFVLPLYSIDHVSVDWGDGDVGHFSASGSKTHVYHTPGIYTIKMYGTGAQMFRFDNLGDRQKVIGGVIGNTGWTSFDFTFFDCISLTTLDVSGWDVSSVTNFRYAFRGCSSLMTLNVSGWDVSSVTTFQQAFAGCSSLTTLNVSSWDVSSVTIFQQAFQGCSSLTALDVSSWDVSSVINFSTAFDGCSSLTAFDASTWIMPRNLSVSSYNATFRNCGTLDLKIGTGWNFRVLYDGYNASTFLQGTDIGSTNYDNMLSIIESQPLNNNVTFGGGNSKYTADGLVTRNFISSSRAWTFIDGGFTTY